ncbi:MAG: hypothetical protein V2J25_04390 [Desulfatiglans sp.]|nr:hypothetical protein [Desulfatiglans sp.]
MRLKPIFLAVLGVIALSLPSCGRKAPPFLPEKTMELRVDRLEAHIEEGLIVLRGKVIPYREREMGDIVAARVYHVLYFPDDKPCEGCPIRFGDYRDFREVVISKDAFYLKFPGTEKAGIHYFAVCLVGQNRGVGPISDNAILSIDN